MSALCIFISQERDCRELTFLVWFTFPTYKKETRETFCNICRRNKRTCHPICLKCLLYHYRSVSSAVHSVIVIIQTNVNRYLQKEEKSKHPECTLAIIVLLWSPQNIRLSATSRSSSLKQYLSKVTQTVLKTFGQFSFKKVFLIKIAIY